MQVKDHKDRLEDVGAVAIAVGFSPAEALAALADKLEWPWPFLSDTERLLYARLGLERALRRAVYNPGTLKVYRKAAARGVPLNRPVEDVLQLGGDAVVKDGRVVRVFRPTSPDDRAPVSALLTAVSEAAAAHD